MFVLAILVSVLITSLLGFSGMLRYRPSEIALTHADINETLCRFARRQAAGIVTAMPLSISGSHGSVSLIRGGPEHSRNQTIVHLGFFPVLRLQSAVRSSASSRSGKPLPDRRIYYNENDSTSVCNAEDTSCPEERDSSSQLSLNPDLLPGPPQRISPGRHIELAEGFAEDLSQMSPPKHEFGFSGFGHTRPNASDDIAHGLPEPSTHPTNNFSELATRIPVSDEGQRGASDASSLRHQNSMMRSPLQAAGPSGQYQKNQALSSSAVEFPMLYLQGYFEEIPNAYSFKESSLVPSESLENPSSRNLRRTQTISSQCESRPNNVRPRRPVQRFHALDAYDESLTSRPSTRRQVRGSSDSSTRDTAYIVSPHVLSRHSLQSENHSSDKEELRSSSHTPKIPSNIQRFLDPRAAGFTLDSPQPSAVSGPRDRNQRPLNHGLLHQSTQQLSQHSEQFERSLYNGYLLSIASRDRPSSFNQFHLSYMLSSSRYSSSDYSQPAAALAQAQCDGFSPSKRPLITPFSSPAHGGTILPPNTNSRPLPARIPSHSSPNLTALYQNGLFGLSQPPARPYGRPDNTQSSPQSSGRIIMPYDFPQAIDSAIDAAQRNFSSPLDLIQQRATSQISHTPSAASYRTATSRIDQHHVSAVNQLSHYTTPDHNPRMDVQYGPNSGQRSINSPFFRLISSPRDLDRYPESDSQSRTRSSAPRLLTHFPALQNDSGSIAGTRSSAISSESVGPANFSLSPPGLNGQDQGNRCRHGNNGLTPSATPWRHPTTRPHSEGGDNNVESRMRLPATSLFPSVFPNMQRPPESMPRHSEPQRTRQRSSHHGVRHTEPGPPTRSQAYPHGHSRPTESRDPGNRWTSHAQRYEPPPPSRRSHLPAWQQEQENSGNAEEDAMREEMQARGMRGGPGNEGDVMNETPPRVGRFEQRILGM